MSAKNILVLDDEPEVGDQIRLMLQQLGYHVDVFINPMWALGHLQTNPETPYSLVISDIRMPGMNGFEFVQRVKKLAPSTKVFLITAYEITNQDVEIAIPNIKVDEFLKKPFDLDVICKMVERHLAQT